MKTFHYETPSSSSLAFKAKRSAVATVLYAENDAAIRELTSQTLRGAGYRVTAVENGMQAWQTLGSSKFDLLITDDELPGLTGLELIRKARREGMSLPAILVPGSADVYLDHDKELPAFARLQKPYRKEELLEVVSHVLEEFSDCWSRNKTFFPSMAEAFTRQAPYEHWGINE